ncbi:type VI secretion system baseplate subunit TssE [Caballeronia novacaledonica]|uniref:Type VI secretion system baseplate subunit TssE n=1 Tax=Caballeronia novacaledonica TaxID=1544861 RepID=A0ACB5QUL2_9BURK|nr:type VI secretion system baseplate subunit TssE [Caballeronia novacaledonica]
MRAQRRTRRQFERMSMTRRKVPLPDGVNGARTPRRADARIMPTLLDRLRDDEPRSTSESPDAFAVSRKQMRSIIQRDLTYLLNTTNIEDRIDSERYPQAAESTVNFGVPPLTGESLASLQWPNIEQALRRVIERFEPRLRSDSLTIRVLDAEKGVTHRNVLSFEVRGEIQMDPYPLEFMVQSSLDLETSQIDMNSAGAD